VDIIIPSVVPDPLGRKLQRETMVSGHEVLHSMHTRAIPSTAKRSAHETDPHIFSVVALVTLHVKWILVWEVSYLVQLGVDPTDPALLNQIRPPANQSRQNLLLTVFAGLGDESLVKNG
jgi:hypothetical protein